MMLLAFLFNSHYKQEEIKNNLVFVISIYNRICDVDMQFEYPKTVNAECVLRRLRGEGETILMSYSKEVFSSLHLFFLY